MRPFGPDPAPPKAHTAGTHRARRPAETLAAYTPRMPALGITRLAGITGLDRLGVPVYLAVRPNARSLSVAQGKGLDADAAKASALMEAIETWHAERIEGPLRRASYRDLSRAAPVVDVTRLPRTASGTLDLDEPLLWIRGHDLLRDEETWVPEDAVTLDMVAEARRDRPSPFFVSGSGLASGNHPVEAAVHALAELIERDAATLHLARSAAAQMDRLVDLDTAADPACRAVLDRIAAAGVLVAAWDITADTAVPAYLAALVEPEGSPRWRTLGSAAGYGCHPSPAVALFRALTEAAQSRATMIAGSRDDIAPEEYGASSNADDQRRLRALLTREGPRIDLRVRPSLATDTFEGDLGVILDALRRVGLGSAAVVDLTRPEIGVPVIKAVVPGLEPPVHGARGQRLLLGARAARARAGAR